jgi:hypothetical protein
VGLPEGDVEQILERNAPAVLGLGAPGAATAATAPATR